MPFYAQYHEHKPVPQGIYHARVDKVEPHQSKFGEMVRWTFTIIDVTKPDVVNTAVSGLTSTKISSKSKLYTWLQAFSNGSGSSSRARSNICCATPGSFSSAAMRAMPYTAFD